VVPDELKKDQEAMKRLKVVVRSNNGFEIAEEDLKLRGPGELLGVSQSGYFGFMMANLARAQDRVMLELAKEDANKTLKEDPNLEKYVDLKKVLIHRYGDKMGFSYMA